MASRLENSARNVLVALCGQAFSIILAFVTRGIFARQLSLEYMGLENLFSNVLTILSLADLGVASAIIFALYRRKVRIFMILQIMQPFRSMIHIRLW